MAEKKIYSIDVAMDEQMYRAIHGLAEADGVSASELMRMLASTMIDDRAAYYARLHNIFGGKCGSRQQDPAGGQQQTGSTPGANAPTK